MALALAGERLREHGLLERARLVPVEPRRAFDARPLPRRADPGHPLGGRRPGLRHRHAGRAPSSTPATSSSTRARSTTSAPTTTGWPSWASAASSASWPTPRTSTGRAPRRPSARSGRRAGRALPARPRARSSLATFASHVHRIQQVLDLAAAFGRRVALLGRSMETTVRLAAELGYLRVPDGSLPVSRGAGRLPPYRQVILSTGSQGEPHSALALMAAGEHKYACGWPRATWSILSARIIPGPRADGHPRGQPAPPARAPRSCGRRWPSSTSPATPPRTSSG